MEQLQRELREGQVSEVVDVVYNTAIAIAAVVVGEKDEMRQAEEGVYSAAAAAVGKPEHYFVADKVERM